MSLHELQRVFLINQTQKNQLNLDKFDMSRLRVRVLRNSCTVLYIRCSRINTAPVLLDLGFQSRDLVKCSRNNSELALVVIIVSSYVVRLVGFSV